MKRCILGLAAILALISAGMVPACPPHGYVPLRRDLALCDFAVVARFVAHVAEGDNHYTVFHIEDSIKRHPALRNQTHLKVPRSYPAKEKLILLGDFFKGEVDVFRAFRASAEATRYVQALTQIDAKDEVALCGYCLRFIDSRDPYVESDALGVLRDASPPTIQKIGARVPRETVKRMMKEQNPEPGHRGLCARLLAGAGQAEDARFLRDLLDGLTEEELLRDCVDLLTSYTLLDPKKGSDYMAVLLQGPELSFLERHFPGKPTVRSYLRPSATASFLVRYGTLRAIKFFVENRPNVIAKADQCKVLALLLKTPELADFVIEDLRRWQRWELTDSVLALWGKENFDTNLIRRAVLRYALHCPQRQTATFVAQLRGNDPEFVEKVQRDLKRETGK